MYMFLLIVGSEIEKTISLKQLVSESRTACISQLVE